MVSKTRHHEHSTCPIACALDLIGDHWTLVIVRDMITFNRHEYHEFLAGDEGISTNILSDRLAKLEANDMVASIPHPESKKRKLYYLTPKGKDLVHVLMAIGRWSAKHLATDVEAPAELRQLVKYEPAALSDTGKLAELLLAQLDEWERRWLPDRN